MNSLSSKQQSFVKLMKDGEDQERRGFELLSKRADLAAFFDALAAEGLFEPSRNSGPVAADKPGYFRVPYWPPLLYLEAAAKLAGEQEDAVLADAEPPTPPDQPKRTAVWTPEATAAFHALRERIRIKKENEGLDIANTEGILPGGGMILMEEPTPQQAAYMGRRLGLMYKREIEENRRNGITKMPKIRGIRPGDLIP